MTNPFLNLDYPLDLSGGIIITGRDVVLKPRPTPPPSQPVSATGHFTLDQLLNGQPFERKDKDKKNRFIGIPLSLQDALAHAGSGGIVLTMPELIAAKVKADKNHTYWKAGYDVHTEENIGPNYTRTFYPDQDHLYVAVNGGGLLPPERILQAYEDGLINGSASYTEQEFKNLLDGTLPDGSTIRLYRYEEIEQGVSDLPHNFGIVMPYHIAQATASGMHTEKAFLTNPLAIARNAGKHNLKEYFAKAKNTEGKLGCWHPFSGRDAGTPQGRLLFLLDYFNGLVGDLDLDSDYGRFVGVAPEAPGAPK